MSRPKGASHRGKGTVREQPLHTEPDPDGSRAARRAWARLYGKPAPPVEDGACCQAAHDSDGFAHDHPVETDDRP